MIPRTVPDVAEAVERVKSHGFEVIKPLDEAKEEQMGIPADAVAGKHGKVPDGYKHLFKQLAFVKDPDVSDSLLARVSGRSNMLITSV